jgi:hypothetical protein
MKKLLFVFMLSLLMIGMAWGQGSENFDNCAATAIYLDGSFVGNGGITWTYGHARNVDTYPIDGNGLMLRRASDSYLQATIPNGVGSFSFQYRKAYTGTSARELELIVNGVQKGTTGSFGTAEPDPTVYTFTLDNINETGNVTVKIKNVGTTTTNRQAILDNITWTGFASLDPTITVSPTTLSDFSYAIGNGPSAEQSFTVSGSNLTANISISAPTNYEISTGTGGSFAATSPITLTQSGGTVSETTIYARLKAGLSAGDYNNENITVSSSGATNKTVTCSGSVAAPLTTTIPYAESFTSNLNGVYTFSVSGTKPWYQSSGTAICNGYNGSGNEEHWLVLPGINFNNYSAERMTFTTRANYGTINATNYLKLMYSTNYSGLGNPTSATWTELSFANGGTNNTTTPSGVINLSDINGTQVFLAFKYVSTDSPTSWVVDDISIYLSTPVVSVGSSLNSFTYEHNAGPSAEQSFTVSGADLTANITVTPPSNYEISTGTGVTFVATNPIVLTQSGGSVSETTIYVRLKENLAIGTYDQDITIASTDAVTQTVTCSGSVTSPPAPTAPIATAATVVGSDSFTANWNSVSGATGYRLDVYEKEVGATATDLFISEYVEGSGSGNKYIEIFNGTGSSVNLSNYTLRLYSNGSSTVSYSVVLDGTLVDGATYVIGRTDGTIYTSSDLTSNSVINFNGDDAIELYRTDTSTSVDIFGRIGDDPGSAWTGNDGYTTVDKTLVRKAEVSQGITANPTGTGPTAFTTLTTEWDMYPQDTATYLGSHTFAGGSTLTYFAGFDNRDVSNVTSYEVTGLDPETTYYYVVRAYDAYSQTSTSSNEIEVTTDAASTYEYPEGTEIDAGVVLIEISGGNGIIVTGEPTPVPNPGFTATFEQRIELTGDGPWLVTVFSLDEWVACLFDGSWIVEEVDGTGYVSFWLEFAKSKNTVIELKSGNGGNPTLPVELSTFTATISSIHSAVLTWVTETETNVNGFYIYRNMESNLDTAILVSNLIPATNTSTQQVYQFTDSELGQIGTYYYWLMVSDIDGSESVHGPISVIYEQGGNTTPNIPQITELKNVYPNPFNPSTTINYALANMQNVSFSIFNSRGQLVRSYQMGTKAAGNHNFVWNGTDENGQTVSTGVYFIRMQAGRDSFSKKAVLMK